MKTSLSSKFLSQNSNEISHLAINAVKKIVDMATADNVDLNDIKIVKKLGGIVDDIKLIDGLVFPDSKISFSGNSSQKVLNPKIAII